MLEHRLRPAASADLARLRRDKVGVDCLQPERRARRGGAGDPKEAKVGAAGGVVRPRGAVGEDASEGISKDLVLIGHRN